jgi:Calcineurin-like phosphoesterase
MKTIEGRFRAAVLMAAAASVLAFAVGARAQDHNDKDGPHHGNNSWPYATTGKSPVLAVVGDISCQPGEKVSGESSKETCTDPKAPYSGANSTPPGPPYSLWQSQEATANQIEAMKPDAVALLGDLQYQVGRYSDFEQSFDLTYGAFKFLHRPAPGNHEFYDEHGETGVAGYGYFSYYNGFLIDTNDVAGKPLTTTISDPCPSNPACGPGSTPTIDLSAQPIPRADGQAGHFDLGVNGGQNGTGVGDGWYSYNLGSWHLISLNIECSTQPGGCSDTGAWFSAELAWLKKDLETNHSACTLAYWHQPSYSAADSLSPEGTTALAFWQLLYEHNADLVLNGHDHLYARYRPLDPSGNYDPHKGIREFIVGTGGETLDAVVTVPTSSTDTGATFNAANLEAATGNYWGVMALTLDEHGYKWDFESALEAPLAGAPASPTYSDKGVGTCHGSADRDDY